MWAGVVREGFLEVEGWGCRVVSWGAKCTQLPRQATMGWDLALTLFHSEAWGSLPWLSGSVSSSVRWKY